jgi:hypothetical protein
MHKNLSHQADPPNYAAKILSVDAAKSNSSKQITFICMIDGQDTTRYQIAK